MLRLLLLVVILREVSSFFPTSVSELLKTNGSLACYVSPASPVPVSGFQLCAIRVYTSASNGSKSVWNGLWSTNAFRRTINQQNCQGFSSTSDLGVGSCNAMPYETVNNFTLCICATAECNENLDTCTASAQRNSVPPLSSSSMPNFNEHLECANTSRTSFVCAEHPFIDATACDDYVRKNGVLCSIVVNGTATTQAVLPDNRYELFLDQTVRRLKLTSQTLSSSLSNESTSNLYYSYGATDASTVQECVCIDLSVCNQNINVCAPQIPVKTTSTLSPSTTSRSAVLSRALLCDKSLFSRCYDYFRFSPR